MAEPRVASSLPSKTRRRVTPNTRLPAGNLSSSMSKSTLRGPSLPIISSCRGENNDNSISTATTRSMSTTITATETSASTTIQPGDEVAALPQTYGRSISSISCASGTSSSSSVTHPRRRVTSTNSMPKTSSLGRRTPKSVTSRNMRRTRSNDGVSLPATAAAAAISSRRSSLSSISGVRGPRSSILPPATNIARARIGSRRSSVDGTAQSPHAAYTSQTSSMVERQGAIYDTHATRERTTQKSPRSRNYSADYGDNGSLLDLTPGAFQMTGKADGDVPVWWGRGDHPGNNSGNSSTRSQTNYRNLADDPLTLGSLNGYDRITNIESSNVGACPFSQYSRGNEMKLPSAVLVDDDTINVAIAHAIPMVVDLDRKETVAAAARERIEEESANVKVGKQISITELVQEIRSDTIGKKSNSSDGISNVNDGENASRNSNNLNTSTFNDDDCGSIVSASEYSACLSTNSIDTASSSYSVMKHVRSRLTGALKPKMRIKKSRRGSTDVLAKMRSEAETLSKGAYNTNMSVLGCDQDYLDISLNSLYSRKEELDDDSVEENTNKSDFNNLNMSKEIEDDKSSNCSSVTIELSSATIGLSNSTSSISSHRNGCSIISNLNDVIKNNHQRIRGRRSRFLGLEPTFALDRFEKNICDGESLGDNSGSSKGTEISFPSKLPSGLRVASCKKKSHNSIFDSFISRRESIGSNTCDDVSLGHGSVSSRGTTTSIRSKVSSSLRSALGKSKFHSSRVDSIVIRGELKDLSVDNDPYTNDATRTNISQGIESGLINVFIEPVQTGECIDLFVAGSGSNPNEKVIIKVIKKVTSKTEKECRSNPGKCLEEGEEMIDRAASTEFENMSKSYEARGVSSVPKPLGRKGNIIFMKCIEDFNKRKGGKTGSFCRLPSLKELRKKRRSKTWKAIYFQIVDQIIALYKNASIVHGNLNENNILVDCVSGKSNQGGGGGKNNSVLIYFTGFSGSRVTDHRFATQSLIRDFDFIDRFFSDKSKVPQNTVEDIYDFLVKEQKNFVSMRK